LKLLYYRLFKRKKLAIAYHEAGHCVVAAIFTDKINLKMLSINKELMKKNHPSYNGGLDFEFINIPNPSENEPADHLILIALAGMCSKTIFNKGQKYVKKYFETFKNNSTQIDNSGANDDYKIVNDYINPLAVRLQIRKDIIQWSGFRWLFDYLMTPEVLIATKLIAEELIRRPSQSIYNGEITDLINSTGLAAYLLAKKNNIISRRYPLTREKLIV